MSLRFAFMLVATPAACLLGILRPFWGLLALVFLYYFRPDVWSAPNWFRPQMWITVSVAIGWLIHVRTFRVHILLGFALLVLLGHLGSALNAVVRMDTALDMVTVLAKLIIVQFLAIQLVDTPRRLNMFLWTNVLGMVWNLKTILYLGLFSTGVTEDLRVDVGVGQGGGANYLAMILVMFLPFLMIRFQNGSAKERLGSMVLIPVTMLCIVLTGSRAGFLATGLTVLVMLFISNRKLLGLVTAGALALVMLVAMPEAQWERLQKGVGPSEQRDFAAQSRVLLWQGAVDMWQEYQWLGVGPDNFAYLSPRYAGFYAGRNVEAYIPGVDRPGFVAHSTWLQTLAEGGLISAVPFLLMFPLAFFFLWRARAAPGPLDEDGRLIRSSATAMIGLWVAFIVGSSFGSHIKLDFLWWYMGCVAVIDVMARSRRQAEFVRSAAARQASLRTALSGA
jgi:O-antigen ligase